MAINNSTFKDEQEIGQEVSKWRIFITKIMTKRSQMFYKSIYLYVTQQLKASIEFKN
jgi:hypothetical protein